MPDVSIANLPAFVGNSVAGDLLVMVDVSDTSESPFGTTKRMSCSQIGAVGPLGDITVTSINTTSDTGYNILGHPLIRTDATYNMLRTPDGVDAIMVGAASDPSIYLNADTIHFRSRTGATEFATLNVNGLVLPKPIVIGTDPGGSYLLRIGGAMKATGEIVTSTGLSSDGGATPLVFRQGATIVGQFDASNAFIVGADPGGAQLLRVGGTIHARNILIDLPQSQPALQVAGGSINVDLTVPGQRAASFINRSTNSNGLYVQGGSSSVASETALFSTAVGTFLLAVLDPTGGNNLTALKMIATDTSGVASVYRVFAVTTGTAVPPGGRVLYLA